MNNAKQPGRRLDTQLDLATIHKPGAEDAVEENAERDRMLGHVEARDLMEFGMIPEFVGEF